MHLKSAVLVAALCGACGGGTAAISVSGTVRGQAFQPVEAESTPTTLTVGGQTGNVLALVLSSTANVCTNVSSTPPKEVKNSEYLVVILAVLTPSLQVVAPTSADVGQTFSVWALGTTAVPPAARFAIVIGQTTDSACSATASSLVGGYSGTVKLTALGADNSATVTMDLNTVPASDGVGTVVAGATPERFAGTASASFCEKLGVFLLPSRGTTCL